MTGGKSLPEAIVYGLRNTFAIALQNVLFYATLLLVEPVSGDAEAAPGESVWRCITGSGRPVRAGQRAVFAGGRLAAEPLAKNDNGTWDVRLRSAEPLMAVLERYGLTPVPPYIHRSGDERQTRLDRERYQTVYSKVNGSAAAPTAGLHFTPELLEKIRQMGVKVGYVTLHVGLGTFRPEKEE